MIQSTSMAQAGALRPVMVNAALKFGTAAEAGTVRPYQKALEQLKTNPKSFTTWVMGGISKSKDGKAAQGGFTAQTPDSNIKISYSLGKKWGILWSESFEVNVTEKTATSWNSDSHTQTKVRLGLSRKTLEGGNTPADETLAHLRGWLDKIARNPIGFNKD